MVEKDLPTTLVKDLGLHGFIQQKELLLQSLTILKTESNAVVNEKEKLKYYFDVFSSSGFFFNKSAHFFKLERLQGWAYGKLCRKQINIADKNE